jgi:hypothetical protein
MIEISKEKVAEKLKELTPAELERLEKYRTLAGEWDNENAFRSVGFVEVDNWGFDKLRIHKEDGIMIKEQYVPDIPKLNESEPWRIPTIQLDREGKQPISIQPLAEIPPLSDRYDLTEFFNNFLYSDTADIHSGNVALYKGLPVLIDW